MKMLFLSVLLFSAINSSAQNELNVLSFNIRYDNANDSLDAWPYRKNNAASQVTFHNVHLLGVQEALYNQVQDLQQRLKGFKYVGIGRADGKTKGEFSAIFYDTARLAVLQSETFWLAEETNVPGKKGWDAAIERIVTWAKFKDKNTDKTFYHFNTHFDHMGQVARRQSAKLLLAKVEEIAGNADCIVTGDFNAHPEDEPIKIITDPATKNRLVNSKSISMQPHYGPHGTFNGFKAMEESDTPIDYIFVKNNVTVLKHATLSDTWKGHFSSDHFPVYAVVRLN